MKEYREKQVARMRDAESEEAKPTAPSKRKGGGAAGGGRRGQEAEGRRGGGGEKE